MRQRLVPARPGAMLGPTAMIAAVALALAACGGAASPVPGTIPPGAIAVAADEYRFDPATLTAPAGEVAFAVTNDGTENHEFEVLAGDVSLGKIAAFGPGTTMGLGVTLEPGEYTFACRLNGHDILGMTGTLTVTGS